MISVESYIQRRLVAENTLSQNMKDSNIYHCGKQFSQQGNLSTHIQSQHDGVKYACDQCDFKATQKNNLKIHIKKKHL